MLPNLTTAILIAVLTMAAQSTTRAMETAGLDTQSCIREQMNMVNRYYLCFDGSLEKTKPHKAGKKCARKLRNQLKNLRRTLCPQNEQPQHLVDPARTCAIDKESEEKGVSTLSRCQSTVAKLYATAMARADGGGADSNTGASLPQDGNGTVGEIVSKNPPIHTLPPKKQDVGARAETINQNPADGRPIGEEHVYKVSENTPRYTLSPTTSPPEIRARAETIDQGEEILVDEHVYIVSKYPPRHTVEPTNFPTQDTVGARADTSNQNQGAGIPVEEEEEEEEEEEGFETVSENPPLHSATATATSRSEETAANGQLKVVMEETESGDTHILIVPETAPAASHPSSSEAQSGNDAAEEEDEYELLLVSNNAPFPSTEEEEGGDTRRNRYLRA